MDCKTDLLQCLKTDTVHLIEVRLCFFKKPLTELLHCLPSLHQGHQIFQGLLLSTAQQYQGQ